MPLPIPIEVPVMIAVFPLSIILVLFEYVKNYANYQIYNVLVMLKNNVNCDMIIRFDFINIILYY
jgi:hypothetical protein